MTDDTHTLELTARQRERLDLIKAECANDHLPEPTDEQMIDSLLDTWDAVGDGLYSNEDTPTDDSQQRRLEESA